MFLCFQFISTLHSFTVDMLPQSQHRVKIVSLEKEFKVHLKIVIRLHWDYCFEVLFYFVHKHELNWCAIWPDMTLCWAVDKKTLWKVCVLCGQTFILICWYLYNLSQIPSPCISLFWQAHFNSFALFWSCYFLYVTVWVSMFLSHCKNEHTSSFSPPLHVLKKRILLWKVDVSRAKDFSITLTWDLMWIFMVPRGWLPII